jgi:nucleotide-binding universal stress UspA family protein
MNLQNILFPVDFSERSRAAAPFVLSMAQRYQARVVLLHVFEPPVLYAGMDVVIPPIYDPNGIKDALHPRLVEFAAAELPGVDASCEVVIGNAAAVIVEFAEANQIDLIAMPTHGYGAFRRALVGSVTAKVLHDARIPVWTSAHAPEPSHRAHPQPRFILAALDLKADSEHTLETALQMGRDAGAHVEVIYVAPEGADADQSENRINELINRVEREPSAIAAQYQEAEADAVVDGGSISDFIRRAALRQRSDLIVIGRGSIQRGGLSRFRANAYGIIREAPCPVLSV